MTHAMIHLTHMLEGYLAKPKPQSQYGNNMEKVTEVSKGYGG